MLRDGIEVTLAFVGERQDQHSFHHSNSHELPLHLQGVSWDQQHSCDSAQSVIVICNKILVIMSALINKMIKYWS